MRIFNKILTIKKTLTYSALLVLSLVMPTSLVFASSSSGPGLLADMLTTLMIPFHFLVTVAGTLMGVTMYYTVVHMGYYVHQLGAIQTAWKLFRDLGNILIVFGFIAIGIATILNNATYGAKKALPKLLIVAVLLNFSLFFAEFIVDAGNVFATQFYSSINGGKLPASASTFSISKEPISNSVMTVLKTTSLYHITKPPLGDGNMIALGILGIIMFIIMAFVFFAIAIMLITRFVVLLFLFIVSPIGFIGLAGIPLISDYGKKWWKALTDQTLFAPILFLFLLVVTKLIQSKSFTQTLSGSTYTGAISSVNTIQLANMVLLFGVVIGLLFMSLIVAKSLSGKAASFAMNWSRRGIGAFASLPIGGGARLIRSTAELTGNNKFSRGVGHLTRPLERASFDMVGSLGGKKFLGMDKADTSYRNIAAHTPFVAENGIIKRIKDKNVAEMKDEQRKREEKMAEQATRKAQDDIAKAQGDIKKAEENKRRNPANSAQYDAQIEAANRVISDNLSKLSTKEISELHGIKDGVGALAQNFSPEKFAMLMKSDLLTDTRKSKLKDERYAPIAQAIASGDTAKIKETSVKDLEQYAAHNPTGFASMGAMLSNSQADTLQKSSFLGSGQMRDLKKARNDRFNTQAGAQDAINSLSTADIAKLPDSVLTKPEALKAIPYEKLKSMLDNPENLSTNAQQALINHADDEIRNHTAKGSKIRIYLSSHPGTAAKWGMP